MHRIERWQRRLPAAVSVACRVAGGIAAAKSAAATAAAAALLARNGPRGGGGSAMQACWGQTACCPAALGRRRRGGLRHLRLLLGRGLRLLGPVGLLGLLHLRGHDTLLWPGLLRLRGCLLARRGGLLLRRRPVPEELEHAEGVRPVVLELQRPRLLGLLRRPAGGLVALHRGTRALQRCLRGLTAALGRRQRLLR